MAITTAAQAAQLVNQTLTDTGYGDYQIDTTSGDTLEAGFKAIGALPPTMRSNIMDGFLDVLEKHTYTSMFGESKNPTRAFWRNAVNYGGALQEIYLQLIEAEDGYWADQSMTDETAQAIATDLVKFKADEISQKVHPIDVSFRLKMSVSQSDISKMFTPSGMEQFLNGKYANFRQSVEAKLMYAVIDRIKKMVSDGKVKTLTGFDLNTEGGVTSFVEALNTVNDGMQTLSAMYNYDEVTTMSPSADYIYLVCTPDVYNRIATRGYANAFNISYYKNNNRIIMLPAGTDLGKISGTGRNIGALLVDFRSIICALRYFETRPFVVSNTNYSNMFTQVQLITGYNEFFNAVAFETGEVSNFTNAGGMSYIYRYNDAPGPIPDVMNVYVNGTALSELEEINMGTSSSGLGYLIYEVPNDSTIEIQIKVRTTTGSANPCVMYPYQQAIPSDVTDMPLTIFPEQTTIDPVTKVFKLNGVLNLGVRDS